MKPVNDLTAEYVRSIIDYNPKTGVLAWKISPRRNVKKGQIINKKTRGYIQTKIKGRPYYAHRLAWLIMTGDWPKHQIDHINGIKDDNRWCNLREATNGQNQVNGPASKNNKLGIKGICKRKNRYIPRIRVNGELINLGSFENLEDAIKARKEAEIKYFGEFANV